MYRRFFTAGQPPENKRDSLVIPRRTVVVFGLFYFFFLIFFFDFFQKSVDSVASLVDPRALVLVPLGVLAAAAIFALLIVAITYRVSSGTFMRSVVVLAALLNISAVVSIGLASPLTWGSLALSAAALVAVWKIPPGRLMNLALLCGIVITGYALISQGLWAWRHWPQPEADTGPAPVNTVRATENRLPSVYLVVMDEFPISLIDHFASFMSLPNLSRLARSGLFLPRAYAIADGTEWSIPAIFTGRYLEAEQAAGKPFLISHTPYRNLPADLLGLGYRLKVYNDITGINLKELPGAADLETGTESRSVVTQRGLIDFAVRHLIRQVTFGLRPAPNIGALLQGESARTFQLAHDPDQPQFVYIHLFDAHHEWIRNRDGSIHQGSPVTFYGKPELDDPEEAPLVARNAFEQYLWADSNAGPLVDSLLQIPSEERIIVFLSDHGISWREPPFGRGMGILHSTQVNVPLVLVAPGLGTEVNPELVPLIDLYPTVIDLINRSAGQTVLEPPGDIDGLSLFTGAEKRRARNCYAYSGNCKYQLENDEWVPVRNLGGKVICSRTPIPAAELASTADAVQQALRAAVPGPLPPMAVTPPSAVSPPAEVALLMANYRGFMIISACGTVYGFPRPDDATEKLEIYLKLIEAGEYYPVYTGNSEKEVVDAISNAPFVAPFPDTLMMVEANYQGFNIVANRGTLYAFLDSEGKFDYERLKNGPYSVLLKGITPEEIKLAINSYAHEFGTVLADDYQGFTIIQADGRVYGFPRQGGPREKWALCLERIQAGLYSPVYTGLTQKEVVAAIDAGPQTSNPVKELVDVESYLGFKILARGSSLYAVLQSDGRFDIGRLENGPYAVRLTGETREEVKDRINNLVYAGSPAIMLDNYRGATVIGAYGTIYAVPADEVGFGDMMLDQLPGDILTKIGNNRFSVVLKGQTISEVIDVITGDSRFSCCTNLLTNPDFISGSPIQGWDACDCRAEQENPSGGSGFRFLKLTAAKLPPEGLRSNLVTFNPGFEAGDPSPAWDTFDCRISWDSKTCYEGKHSLKVVARKDSFGDAGTSQNLFRPEYRGRTFTFGAWVMAPVSNDKTQALGIWDGVSVQYTEPVPHDGNWHWISVTKTLDKNATQLRTYAYVLQSSEPDNDDVLNVDSVCLFAGEVPPAGAGLSQNSYQELYRGQTFTFGAWVMAPVDNDKTQVLCISDGVSQAYSAPVPHDGNWHRVTVTKTLGENATELRASACVLKGAEPDTDDVLYVDSAMLFVNLVTANPGFEAGDPPPGWGAFDCRIAGESQAVCEGAQSLKVTAEKEKFGDAGASQNVFKPEYRGRTFTFGAWVMAPPTNDKTQTLGIWDGVSVQYSESVPHDGKWHWITVTKTLDISATELRTYSYVLKSSAPDSDDILCADCAVLINGDYLPAVLKER